MLAAGCMNCKMGTLKLTYFQTDLVGNMYNDGHILLSVKPECQTEQEKALSAYRFLERVCDAQPCEKKSARYSRNANCLNI